VDIDKGIPSAIKVLGNYLVENGITHLASLYAGERRNSIPANAVAIIRSESELSGSGDVTVRELKEQPSVLKEGEKIIHLIHAFKQGGRADNKELGIPDVSINLAIITADEKGGIDIETSARAMDADSLEALTEETVNFFESYGFSVKVEDKYPAWKPDVSEFTDIVSREMKKVFGSSKLMAFHAGLECGVIAEKYPTVKFASIGPTIRYPHSIREMVNMESVEKTYLVLKEIIKSI
jgi:dipeptidase D